jgi:antitoxin component YwqK of YwqJK toxin-antitoxin module
MLRLLCLALIISFTSCGVETEEKIVSSHSDGAPKVVHTIQVTDQAVVAQTNYYDNGGVEMTGGMADGKRHGTWESFFYNGQPWTVNNYDHGVLHGEYIMYNKGGSLKLRGHYTQGEESGHWEYFDIKGNPVREEDK